MKQIVLTPSDTLPNLTPRVLYADAETTSGEDRTKAVMPYLGHKACGWAVLCDEENTAFYAPIRHRDPETENLDLGNVNRWMQGLFSGAKQWVNHFVKFDRHVAEQDGLEFDGELVCTNNLAKCVDSDRYSHELKPLCKEWLGMSMSEADEVDAYLKGIKLPNNAKCQDYGRVPAEILGRYACMDVEGNRALWKYLQQKQEPEQATLWQTEIDYTSVLFRMERRGLWVNELKTKTERFIALTRMIELMERYQELTDRVLSDSSKLHFEVFCGRYGLPVLLWNYKRTEDGEKVRTGPSFSKDALDLYAGNAEVIANPEIREVVELVRKYRKWRVYESLFLGPFLELRDKKGFLHSSYNQTIRTSRMSCKLPNSQQFDERASALIEPEPGRIFLCADCSQGEFRIIIHTIKDETAIEAYRKDPRTDFHKYVADACHTKRKPAKTLNFLMGYGGGKDKLVSELAHNPEIMEEVRLELEDEEWAADFAAEYARRCDVRGERIFHDYHARFPGIRETSRKATQLCKRRGWIRNSYKRRRHLPYKGAHKAFNTRIQSDLGDMIKELTVKLEPVLEEMDMRLLANKHDELLMDGPVEIDRENAGMRVLFVLERPSILFRVPMKWDLGWSTENWKEAKG